VSSFLHNASFWSVSSILLQEIIIGDQRAAGCDTRKWH